MKGRLISALASAGPVLACAPEYDASPEPETLSRGAEAGSDTGASSEPESSDSGASSDDEGPSECEFSEDCPAQRPYCHEARCVDCAEIGHAGCLARDETRPFCDVDTGECVQCTPDLLHHCTDTTPVCDAGTCRGCEDASECEGYCNEVTGQCDASDLQVQVYRWDLLDEPSFDADRVEYQTHLWSDWGPTDSDGLIEFVDVPYTDTFRIGARSVQLEPVSLGSAYNWLWWPRPFPGGDESKLRLPYLNKGMLGRLAYECGLFANLEAATGQDPVGLPSEFGARATYLVELVGRDASPAPVPRSQINLPFGDHVLHHGDTTDLMPVFICDVEELGALRVGNPNSESVGTHGWFLVFGLHDPNESPFGTAGITIPGYQILEFDADSSAGLYYLRLRPS